LSIADNLADVKGRIAEAAQRAGRSATDVTLIAVSKTFSVGHVREAWDAGQRDFGENKVQEALQKIAETADIPRGGWHLAREGASHPGIRWHLIGHLQSNKARKAAGAFACIHSIDSVELLGRVDAAAAELDTSAAPEVLIQVDFAGEATKFGASPDEARRCVYAAADAKAVVLTGLMLLPPWNEDPEQTRPWFVRLREFRDGLLNEGIPASALHHLSMGMSHDFEAAIEEGSTLVRVGTAIFGKRQARPDA
jgi:pyridoxal phosphate enzyme (YggS family)